MFTQAEKTPVSFQNISQSKSLRSTSEKPNKHLVGTIKAGTMNYLPDMKAFDPELIPAKAKKAVEEVKDFIALDILGLKQSAWNTSTYVERMKFYSDQVPFEKKKFDIRKGLRDEFKLEQRPNKIYTGTETREDYTNWNVSVDFNLREANKQLQNM